ncbi:MAG TPA: DUF4129 domain-containing protein, partial [Myxococcales bacterium]|nr:DUF4129 domain-containing protein [Myxococcales bacterium]
RLSAARPGAPEFRSAIGGVALLGGLIALVAVFLRRARRGQRPRAAQIEADQRRAQALWRRARERIERVGVALPRSVSPRGAIGCVAGQRPEAAAAMEELASAVLAARWGGERLPAGRARELLRDLRRQLEASR